MATLTITNSSAADVYCSDLYVTIPAGKSVSTTRSVSDLSKMAGLQSLIAAGTCAVSVAYSATEKASGLVDEGEAAASGTGVAMSGLNVIRVPMTAGAGGAADDVTVFALNSLPYNKMRVMDVWAIISVAVGASNCQVRSQAAGAGTLINQVAGTPTGRQAPTATSTASTLLTNGATTGLFIRRSDSGIAGEVFLSVRQEV